MDPPKDMVVTHLPISLASSRSAFAYGPPRCLSGSVDPFHSHPLFQETPPLYPQKVVEGLSKSNGTRVLRRNSPYIFISILIQIYMADAKVKI